MTHPARLTKLAAAALILLLASCSGSSSGTALDGGPTALPVATTAPEPASAEPTNPSELTNQAEPTEVATPEPVGPTTVQLWFPHSETVGTIAPNSTPVLDAHDVVERLVTFDEDATIAQRLSTVIDLFIAGPTEAEAAAGFDYSLTRVSHCVDPFSIEATATAAVVTLCPARDPGSYLGQVIVLAQVIEMTGLVDEAVILESDGDRCIPGFEPDDALACLPDEFRDRPGFRCPFGRAPTLAVVTGVDEWANVREGPSIEEDVVDQVFVDMMLEAFPSTLRSDESGQSWMTVRLPSHRGQCASIAAQFLTGTFGNMGDVLPGVSFELPPSSSEWFLYERESAFDHTRWHLSGGFETHVSVQVLAGKRIDEQLDLQPELDENRFVDFPDGWHREVNVDGADRAIRALFVSPADGGIEINQLMVEVGDFTIMAVSGVQYGVVDRVSPEGVEVFLSSFRVDRETFVNSLTVPDPINVTLHGIDYVAVSQIRAGYNEYGICGWRYEFFAQDRNGARTYAGWMRSTNLTELDDGYLLWEVYCEGAGPVSFHVGRVDSDGTIEVLGGVHGGAVGVRGEFGSHTVDDNGTITFEGNKFGSEEILTDTFTLDDVLAQLPQ